MEQPSCDADWTTGAMMVEVDRGKPPYVSNRSVQLMDPHQAERKRAMDRVNQRASRAKTKSRIRELEVENRALKERLDESERRESKLRAILEKTQASLLTFKSLDVELSEVLDSSSTEARRTIVTNHGQPQSLPSSQCHLETPPTPPSVPAPAPADPNTVDISLAAGDPGTGLGLGLGGDMASPEWINLWSEDRATTGNFLSLGWVETRGLPPATGEDQRLDETLVMGIQPMATTSTSEAAATTNIIPDDDDDSAHTTTLQHLSPTCQLDRVVLDIIRACTNPFPSPSPSSPSSFSSAPTSQVPPPSTTTTAAAAAGGGTTASVNIHLSEIRSPDFPSIPSLLNPRGHRDKYPISSSFGDHASWMTIPGLPEKMASLYTCSTVTRWLASPSRETWLAMPQHMRPTPAQRKMPHPVWVDMVHWPLIRERAVTIMDWRDFHKFRMKTSLGLSVNWPHGKEGIFETVIYTVHPDGGDESGTADSVGGYQQQKKVRLSDRFVKHIRDLSNWTLNVDFSMDFPFFEGVAPKTKLGNMGQQQ